MTINTKGSKQRTLPLEQLHVDPECQVRVRLDAAALDDYAAVYADEEMARSMPPITAYPVNGHFVIVDGFHRYYAALKSGLETVPVRVLKPNVGEEDAAVEARTLALQANQEHGVRLAPADRRRAVELALRNPWLADASVRRLSEVLGLPSTTIYRIRKELENPPPPEDPEGDEDQAASPAPVSEAGASVTPDDPPPEEDDEPEAPPPARAAMTDVDALKAADSALRTAHTALVNLHQESGLPVIRESFLVLNAARQAVALELKGRT
jgi:ParB-like chromosome segregation protein Spo0J